MFPARTAGLYFAIGFGAVGSLRCFSCRRFSGVDSTVVSFADSTKVDSRPPCYARRSESGQAAALDLIRAGRSSESPFRVPFRGQPVLPGPVATPSEEKDLPPTACACLVGNPFAQPRPSGAVPTVALCNHSRRL